VVKNFQILRREGKRGFLRIGSIDLNLIIAQIGQNYKIKSQASNSNGCKG
jgi:hypothetical protein